MKYRSYRAYTGHYYAADPGRESIENVLEGINSRREKIISVTQISEGNYVLIITLGQDD